MKEKTTLPYRQSTFATILLGGAMILSSCTRIPLIEKAPEEDELIPDEVLVEQVSDVDAPLSEEETFWLRLLVAPDDGSEGKLIDTSHGFTISELDYERSLESALKNELSGSGFDQEHERELLLLKWLIQNDSLKDPDLRVRLRRLIREALSSETLEIAIGKIDVSDYDAARLYESRIDAYTSEEMVEIRIILVPTEEEAEEVMNRIESGEEFGDIAASVSRHESRSKEGSLEPFSRGTYLKDLEDTAFRIQPGETETVYTAAGVFIVRKTAHIPGATTPFEQVKGELIEELSEGLRARRLDALMIELNGLKE